MIDQDVLFGKINTIQNCLKRIHETVKNNPSLWNYDAQDIIVLNLQRAVQSSIDTAAYIVSEENLGLVTSLKDLFVCLEKNNVIDHSLAEKMRKMVGFRNIAVHEYQEIDVEILRAVVSKHLGDFEEFYSSILNYHNSKEEPKS